MLIHSASQLLTLAGPAQRGSQLGYLGIIEEGAVQINNGLITRVGHSRDLLSQVKEEAMLDASGCVVMPGFIDAHTHLAWVGDRAAEFEERLKGKSYLEIQAAGGGILSTVNATRRASQGELLEQTRKRAQAMFALGTTTAEAKSGYGLEWESELRQMEVLLELNAQGPLEILPTFLPAHSVPAEYKENPQAYTQLICEQMLPKLKECWKQHAPQAPLPWVDVFCEQGAFDLSQTRQILTAASALGFPTKVHADEFANLGGVRLAVELGATSVDHVVHTSAEEIRLLGKSQTVAVSLPCTPFGLAETSYTPAKTILEADGILAIASDLNPGTAWCGNMQFALALACRYLHLTPAQAISTATINAAAAIHCANRLGSLEVGKQADLLVLNIPSYQHLGYRFGENLVKHVVKRGTVYSLQDTEF